MQYRLHKIVGRKMVYKPITIGEKNLAEAIGVKNLKSILRTRSNEAPVTRSKKMKVPRRSVSFSDERAVAKFVPDAPPSKCIVEKGIEVIKHNEKRDLTEKLEHLSC